MSWLENPDLQNLIAEAAQAQDTALASIKFFSMTELAYLVAAADGAPSDAELSNIVEKIVTIAGGKVGGELIRTSLNDAANALSEHGADARYGHVAEVLSTDSEREVAFLVAANVAWQDGGVDVKEGLALQAISRAFSWEISHMHKLLGKAKD